MTIHRKGIGIRETRDLVRLEDEIIRNGHQNRNITYLKIDVEGAEREILPNLIKSGVLERVKQIGVEFHGVVKQVSLY